jgi:hypothetical protein
VRPGRQVHQAPAAADVVVDEEEALFRALESIDAEAVGAWLTAGMARMRELRGWWTRGTHAVDFAQYWLAKSDGERRGLLASLAGDCQADLQGACRLAQPGLVSEAVVQLLMRLVFPEFPGAFEGAEGARTLLDYLCILSFGVRAHYRDLLADVSVPHGFGKQFQWLLACRSHAVTVVVVGCVAHFCELTGDVLSETARPDSCVSEEAVEDRFRLCDGRAESVSEELARYAVLASEELGNVHRSSHRGGGEDDLAGDEVLEASSCTSSSSSSVGTDDEGSVNSRQSGEGDVSSDGMSSDSDDENAGDAALTLDERLAELKRPASAGGVPGRSTSADAGHRQSLVRPESSRSVLSEPGADGARRRMSGGAAGVDVGSDAAATAMAANGAPAVQAAEERQMRRMCVRIAYTACRLGMALVLEYMVDRGVPLDARDGFGRSLAMTAVAFKQMACLEVLCRMVRDDCGLNDADDTGNTPLHTAASLGV